MMICKTHHHNYPHQVDGKGACPSCERKTKPEQYPENRDQPNRKKGSSGAQSQKRFGELSKHAPTNSLRSLSDMSSAVVEPDE